MTDIRIHTTEGHQVTCVPNAFIDEYMTDANGEFVKIYLFLLRMLSQGEGHFCLSVMADKFNYTENDIRRGLSYWEKMHLLHLEYDDAANLSGICLMEPQGCSHVTVSPSSAGLVPTPSVPKKTQEVPNTDDVLHTSDPINQYTPDQLSEFCSQNNVRVLFMVAEKYIGHPLNMTEINTILFWYDQLRFSTELIEFLIEYCVEKGHSSFHYINKVALNWARDGISSVEDAKRTANIHSQVYYAVMKAFGISGRNLIENEISYIDKWTNHYGLSLDLITEACSRTIRNIGKANFSYADTILENWHKKGIQHLEDITALDKAHAENKISPSAPRKNTSNNRFHNFEQRQYDDDFYDALEQQLLRK